MKRTAAFVTQLASLRGTASARARPVPRPQYRCPHVNRQGFSDQEFRPCTRRRGTRTISSLSKRTNRGGFSLRDDAAGVPQPRRVARRDLLDVRLLGADADARREVVGLISASGGTTSLHASIAQGQRVWKRQPGGGLIGEGTSPCEDDALARRFDLRVGDGHRRDQRLRVGHQRVVVDASWRRRARRACRGTSRPRGRRRGGWRAGRAR